MDNSNHKQVVPFWLNMVNMSDDNTYGLPRVIDTTDYYCGVCHIILDRRYFDDIEHVDQNKRSKCDICDINICINCKGTRKVLDNMILCDVCYGNTMVHKENPVVVMCIDKAIKEVTPINIGVDLDDTLCDFSYALMHYFNSKFDTSFTCDDMKDYDFSKIWGIGKQKSHETMQEFIFHDHGLQHKPLPHAYERLLKLKNEVHCNLHIITARDYRLFDATHKWIDMHYPNLFKSIEFGNLYGENNYPKKKKSEMCNDLRIQILIEDSVSHITDCISSNDKFIVYVIQKPWNKRFLKSYVTLERLFITNQLFSGNRIKFFSNWNEFIL